LLGESGVSQESTQVEDQDKKHPKLYKLNWLNWDNMVIMNKWCVVLFSIEKRYFNSVCCDVMDVYRCVSSSTIRKAMTIW